ncbi:MAG: aldehyde dehydrogenase [Bacillales bacterium]|nr:aldehyde dehydrogenase [Bacillales bacterium]MDD7381323.1 aldehyde dehydrogenase [Bacillales bacterium]
MTREELDYLLEIQKEFFRQGNTLSYKWRKKKLLELKANIKKYEKELLEGLRQDLGKSHSEGYMCEVGLVYDEISHMVKHIKKYASPKKVHTPLAQTISKSFRFPSPYGTVLVMSPWNYPFLLSFDPIVDALAAGNTILFKPSRYSSHTNVVMKKILDETFTCNEVITIFGGHEENQLVLDSKVDYIFFTGGKVVGKIVYEKAMEKMIPFSLELGGKSPCIVDNTAKIKLSAKRIVFGKLLNAGQTCVAPDYLYCHEDIKDELVKEIIHQIKEQYGDNPLQNDAFGKMISKRHFDKVVSLMENQNIIYGGKFDETSLKIEPTIIDNPKLDSLIMQEEIFGPLLPVITFKNIDEVIKYVNNGDSPLALYYFSKNKKDINKVISSVAFGGGCINDTIIHLATSHMPFGGVGASGIGAYHGKVGFDTFVHYKSIVDKKTILDLPMRYQPYKKVNDKLIRMFLK